MVISEGIGESEQELCKAINAKVSMHIDSCSPYAGSGQNTRRLSGERHVCLRNAQAVAAKEPTCRSLSNVMLVEERTKVVSPNT